MPYEDVLTMEEWALLDAQSLRVGTSLSGLLAAWQESASGPSYDDLRRQLRSLDRDILVALVVWIVRALVMEPWNAGRHVHLTHVLGILIGRSLPYSSADATLLVALAACSPDRLPVRAALVAAERSTPGPELDHALIRLLASSESCTPLQLGKIADLLPRVRSLLMSADSDIPDLAVIGSDDRFGPAAAALLTARATAGEPVNRLLTELVRPRGAVPGKGWLLTCEQLLKDESVLGELVHDLVKLITEVDLTETTELSHGIYVPPILLLGEANSILGRSAVWLMRLIDTPDQVELLGEVASRCSAPNPGHANAGATVPLASKVAYAAIDTLASLDNRAARAELTIVYERTNLAQTIRRAGLALGESESQIRRTIDEKRRGRRPRVSQPPPT